VRIARVIGKMHRVDEVHLKTQELQRKDGSFVPNVCKPRSRQRSRLNDAEDGMERETPRRE
jgi:hypothetical protein